MAGEHAGDARGSSSIRVTVTVAVSLAIWCVSLVVATLVLNREPDSPWLRGAMVLLAVFGFGAWMWSSFAAIRAQDEFTQRLHLIALATAFAVVAVASFSVDFLQRAGLVGDVPTRALWMVMVVTWWLSILFTHRLYR